MASVSFSSLLRLGCWCTLKWFLKWLLRRYSWVNVLRHVTQVKFAWCTWLCFNRSYRDTWLVVRIRFSSVFVVQFHMFTCRFVGHADMRGLQQKFHLSIALVWRSDTGAWIFITQSVLTTPWLSNIDLFTCSAFFSYGCGTKYLKVGVLILSNISSEVGHPINEFLRLLVPKCETKLNQLVINIVLMSLVLLFYLCQPFSFSFVSSSFFCGRVFRDDSRAVILACWTVNSSLVPLRSSLQKCTSNFFEG